MKNISKIKKYQDCLFTTAKYQEGYKEITQPFEEYLRNQHAKGYNGTDDNMPDSFENWLTNLQVDDLISHGDNFAKELLRLSS